MWVVCNMRVLGHFGVENCIWVFLSDFGTFLPKYVCKCLNNIVLIKVQNVSRPNFLWIIYTLKNTGTVWHMKM